MRETRRSKISIGKPGGTEGKGSRSYRIILPNNWMNDLSITPDDRDVDLEFHGKKIIIKKIVKI